MRTRYYFQNYKNKIRFRSRMPFLDLLFADHSGGLMNGLPTRLRLRGQKTISGAKTSTPQVTTCLPQQSFGFAVLERESQKDVQKSQIYDDNRQKTHLKCNVLDTIDAKSTLSINGGCDEVSGTWKTRHQHSRGTTNPGGAKKHEFPEVVGLIHCERNCIGFVSRVFENLLKRPTIVCLLGRRCVAATRLPVSANCVHLGEFFDDHGIAVQVGSHTCVL